MNKKSQQAPPNYATLEGTEYESIKKKGPALADIFKLIMENCPQLGDTTYHNANTTSKVWALAGKLEKAIAAEVEKIVSGTSPTARANNYRAFIMKRAETDAEYRKRLKRDTENLRRQKEGLTKKEKDEAAKLGLHGGGAK